MGMAHLPQNKTAIQLAVFVERAAKELEREPDTIKDWLRLAFQSYSPAKEAEYMVHLRNQNAKLVVQEEFEAQQIKQMEEKLRAGVHTPDKCPYHPEATVFVSMRWGRKGWYCSAGGVRCFHRWRVTEIAQKRGVHDLDRSFATVDEWLKTKPDSVDIEALIEYLKKKGGG